MHRGCVLPRGAGVPLSKAGLLIAAVAARPAARVVRPVGGVAAVATAAVAVALAAPPRRRALAAAMVWRENDVIGCDRSTGVADAPIY